MLTFLVVLVWGVNFLFMSLGLEEMSPLLLCALRFLVSAFPAAFFIKLPRGSLKFVILYGLVMFALQFSFLFTGIHLGVPAGTASMLMQTQVFFSIFFAILFLGERPHLGQMLGALVAFSGIGILAWHLDKAVSIAGFISILLAAASWGIGNLISKKLKRNTNIKVIIAWGSLYACLPMFLLTWLIEGSSSFIFTYEHLSWKGILSLLYIAFISTWMGYGVWNWLVERHPVGLLVPFTLLIPIIAMIISVFLLNESFQTWKLFAGVLVMLGLGINLLGSRFSTRRAMERYNRNNLAI